jgi:hypothetical protein
VHGILVREVRADQMASLAYYFCASQRFAPYCILPEVKIEGNIYYSIVLIARVVLLVRHLQHSIV